MGAAVGNSSPANSAWQRRVRRLFWFLGAAGTFYYISSYALDRMREARIRAVRDRKQRDLIKSHFTSLLSTISFTLYALLPNLSPQIADAFPVEATSLALQGIAALRPGAGAGAGAGGQPEPSTSAEASASASAAESDGGSLDSRRASEVAETPEGSVVLSRDASDAQQGDAQGSGEYVGGRGHEGEGAAEPNVQVQHSQYSEPSTSQSWASEFEQSSSSSVHGTDGMEDSGVLSMGHTEHEDGLASAISQATSLPTDIDISNFSGSPPSDLSNSILHSPSPPRGPRSDHSHSHSHSHSNSENRSSRSPTQSPSLPSQSAHLPPTVPVPAPAHASQHAASRPDLSGKSKKELWRDLKTVSISRAITTAILIPLLHLLTVSQLSTLARRRYLEDVASSMPTLADPRAGGPSSSPRRDQNPRQRQKGSKSGWLHSFSIEGMGLGEFVEESASLLPSVPSVNPLAHLPTAVVSRLPVPSFLRPHQSSAAAARHGEANDWTQEYEASGRLQEEQDRAEAERMYLTYSWWILHEGWKEVKDKVDEEVERVFGSMLLKRELRAEDWEGLINEVVRGVLGDDYQSSPLSISTTLLPPTPLPALSSCPLPLTPASSPSLLALLHETRTHLASPDAHYLVSRGVDSMLRRLHILIKEEVYGIPEFTVLGAGAGAQIQPAEGTDVNATRGKRLVDCLPALGKWGKDTWMEVPDAGVEGVLGGLEGEGMAGLIFGDWATRV